MLAVSETVLSVSKSAKAMKEARWTIQQPGPMMRDAERLEQETETQKERQRKADRDRDGGRDLNTARQKETQTDRQRKREIETGRGRQRQSGVRMCMLLSSGPAAH